MSDPRRVLDVGCGTGRLLRLLATTFPGASELRGIDPAPSMIAVAVTAANDERLRFESGRAEQLPYPDGHFDLVLAVTSFDHWIDQRAGLREVGRILGAGGHLVLVDVFSALLTPTLVGDRRTKTRTRQRAERLLGAAGFASPTWHNLYTPIIKAVTAVSPDTTRIGPSPD